MLQRNVPSIEVSHEGCKLLIEFFHLNVEQTLALRELLWGNDRSNPDFDVRARARAFSNYFDGHSGRVDVECYGDNADEFLALVRKRLGLP